MIRTALPSLVLVLLVGCSGAESSQPPASGGTGGAKAGAGGTLGGAGRSGAAAGGSSAGAAGTGAKAGAGGTTAGAGGTTAGAGGSTAGAGGSTAGAAGATAGAGGGGPTCSAETTCNGHGTCGADGSCVCTTGFAGAACDTCAPGYTGFPTCVAPVVAPLGDSVVHKGPYPPDLAFGADGTLFLAHGIEIEGNVFRLAVSKLQDGKWQQLGGEVADPATAYTGIRPSLVVTPQGPLAVWASNFKLLARVFDGTTWQPVDTGGATVFGGTPLLADAATDSLGRPVIAYVNGNAIQTLRLEGGAFVPLGTPFPLSTGGVKIALRPDDTLVALVTTVEGFGTSVSVLEQTAAGVWSTLGTPKFAAVGDTTQQIDLGDIDVTATDTIVSWNKGTCNDFPRFIAKAPAFESFGEAGAVGGGLSQLLDGDGLIQALHPNCASSAEHTLQRWTGTAWQPQVKIPFSLSHAELSRNAGKIYLSYWSNSATANVGLVNLP